MKARKKFDCVRMKDDIQAKIERECKGLSNEERSKRAVEAILKNPILAKIWNNARRVKTKSK
jgi:hypothetical protein